MTTAFYFDEMLPPSFPDPGHGVDAEDRQEIGEEDKTMRTHNADIERIHEVDERSEKKNRNASPSDAVRDLQVFATGDTGVDRSLVVAVQAKLNAIYPCRVAKVEDGMFTVDVEAPLLQEARLVDEFNRVAEEISGVRGVRVHILPAAIWGLG
jgi:hypothetical protein